MRPAFPASDYYGGSVPSPGHQLTANLPVATLAGRRRGQPEDGSHVHHAPVGRIGAQLFPCSIATPTPQTFNVASRSVSIPGLGVASRFVHLARTAARPASTRLEPVPRLRGFKHWFTLVTPICLASRAQVVWQYQPVPALSGLLAALPCTSRFRLPSASNGPLRRTEGGSFHPAR